MNFARFLIPLLLASFFGCAAPPRLSSQFPKADQSLTAPVPEGLSRVVIYNSSNGMLYGVDHTDRMQVLIDGRALGSIDHGEYVQVFLPPGRHDFALRRRDVIAYETEHPILIDRAARWLNIRGDSEGNQFEPRDEAPKDFEKKYRPIGER